MREVRQGILVGLIASLFLLLLIFFDFAWAGYANANLHRAQLPYFRVLNRFIYDVFFSWRASSLSVMQKEAEFAKQHPEDSIVIFYIDKLTLQYARDHFHEEFPWPRSRYAGAIEDLFGAGARAIGVDILFSTPGKGDSVLLKTLRTSHAVSASRFVYAKNTIQDYEPPVFNAQGIPYGFVDVTQDEDHLVRQSIVKLSTHFSDNPWSFDAALLSEGLQKKVGIKDNRLFYMNREAPLHEGILLQRKVGASPGSFLSSDVEPAYPLFMDINYMIPNNFIHYPLYALWDENRPQRLREVKDKIVLIGANAAEGIEIFGNDLFATPVGLMNGVEIHAQSLRTILEHRPLVDLPSHPLLLVLVIFGIGLLYGGGLPLLRGWSRFFFGALLLIGEVAGAYLLFREQSVRLPLAYMTAASCIDFGAVSFYFYVLSRKEIESVKHLFEGYLSPKVVSTLLEDENRNKIRKQLVGDKNVATILYSDIRGFTNLSESLSPQEVVNLLNEYFPPMTAIVHKLGGYLDKFIGDAIMAVFTAPFPQPDDPWLAVQAAVEMQRAATRLGENWAKQGLPTFQIGIGINTGEVVLGNVGSEYKKDYTVIGDSVNIAARLCSLATAGQILISEATYALVKDKVKATSLGPIPVKGKKLPVQTYEVTYWKTGDRS